MTVKISAQLTRDRKEFSGLDSIAQELVDQPHGTRYAVIAYEVLRNNHEIKEGVIIPTIRLTHIEPVRDDHAEAVKTILAERYKDRTGKEEDVEPEAMFDVLPDGSTKVPEAGDKELLAEAREAREAQDGGES